MSRTRWFIPTVLPLLALVAACTDNASVAPQPTGKVDAGMPDAGTPDASMPADAGDAAEADAGPWMPPEWGDPVWDTLPETPVGCVVERIRPSGSLTAFSWAPCDAQAGCEQMRFPPWLSSNSTTFDNASVYATDMYTSTTDTVFTLTLVAVEWSMTLFIRQDGTVIDGFRIPSNNGQCLSYGGSVWKTQYGQLLRRKISSVTSDFGGFIASTVDPAKLTMFEHKPGPPGMGAAFLPMGESRWIWTNSCKYVSVSAIDGLDLQTAAICNSATLKLSYMPTLTGKRFLFAETWTPDNLTVKSRISYTEGTSTPTPFLEPQDDSFYEDPTYAHSHLAWARGIGLKGAGLFDAVEIWASKYSDDPSQIQPYKVGDYALTTSVGYRRAGGFGRLAVLSGTGDQLLKEFVVWDLEQKTKRAITLPGGRRLTMFIGMTPTHVWTAGASGPNMPVDAIHRFQVQP